MNESTPPTPPEPAPVTPVAPVAPPAPTPPPAPVPTAYAQPHAPGAVAPAENPGKTLGLVGFILSFFFPPVGLGLSIGGLVKSKKAGHPNGLALAGIIIGACLAVLYTIVTVLMLLAVVGMTGEVLTQCSQTTAPGVTVNGEYFSCAGLN